ATRSPVESEKLADATRVLVELKHAGKTPPQGPDESGDEGGDEPQRNQHSDAEEDEDEDNEAQPRRRQSVAGKRHIQAAHVGGPVRRTCANCGAASYASRGGSCKTGGERHA